MTDKATFTSKYALDRAKQALQFGLVEQDFGPLGRALRDLEVAIDADIKFTDSLLERVSSHENKANSPVDSLSALAYKAMVPAFMNDPEYHKALIEKYVKDHPEEPGAFITLVFSEIPDILLREVPNAACTCDDPKSCPVLPGQTCKYLVDLPGCECGSHDCSDCKTWKSFLSCKEK